MKQRFLNQKLGKRGTHRADELCAKIAGRSWHDARRKGMRQRPGKTARARRGG